MELSEPKCSRKKSIPENGVGFENTPRCPTQGWSKSPFLKQCFATSGVILSTTGGGVVICFSSVLLPQLKQSKEIALDSERESWIASIIGLSNIIGIITVPLIMGRFGRRTANVISNSILTMAWFGLWIASDYHSILFIRFLQGLSIGMTSILAPVIIGEYTSPKYRGAFLSTIAISIPVSLLTLHSLAVIFNWKQQSLLLSVALLIDSVIIMCSPETPSFLAARGRYEECRKAFRWLRYPEEEVELEKLIKTNMRKSKIINENTSMRETIYRKYNYFLEMVQKKEFYKPVIIMFHLHIINEWSACNLIEAYTTDMYNIIIGENVNVSLVMIFSDVLKLTTSFIAVITIRKMRRRMMLLGTISLNILSFLLTAGHVYAKRHGIFKLDYPIIGIVLVYFHCFTLSVGNLLLPNIISGEIFCLEYRGISSMITALFYCVNMVINMKTALYLFAHIGLDGAYMLYASLVAYGLVVSMIMLPETKDKTLQDIEEEFRGVKEGIELEAFISEPKI